MFFAATRAKIFFVTCIFGNKCIFFGLRMSLYVSVLNITFQF